MKPKSNLTYDNNFLSVSLDMIHNSKNLNIFSDASMRQMGGGILSSCYGSVVVQQDTIIDEQFKFSSDCTVPAAELRGVRLSLDLALRYKDKAPVINIFSDSQVAILSLREYFYSWIYNFDTNMYYIKTSKRPAKNQELIIECLGMLNKLRLTNVVNLYHQKGHVDNSQEDLKNAIFTFKKANYIDGKIDYNFIRYISIYNNYVDNKSRSILRRTNVRDNIYRDPVIFCPMGNTSVIYQNQL